MCYLLWPSHCRAQLLFFVLLCPPSFWARQSSALTLNLSGTSKDQLVVTSVFHLSCQQQKLLHCPRQLEKLLLSLLCATPCRWAISQQFRLREQPLCLNIWETCQKDMGLTGWHQCPLVGTHGKELQRCSVIVKNLKAFCYPCWVGLGQRASSYPCTGPRAIGTITES